MRLWAWVLGALAVGAVMVEKQKFLAGLSRARAMIETWEGFSGTPYRDQAGHWTIGYGHLVRPDQVFPSGGISKETAQTMLEQDMSAAATAVDTAVTVPLSAGQRAALVSFTFNVGSQNFRSSTLLRLLNAGDYAAAADQFGRWDKYTDPGTGKLVVSTGLSRRRGDERKVFVS